MIKRLPFRLATRDEFFDRLKTLPIIILLGPACLVGMAAQFGTLAVLGIIAIVCEVIADFVRDLVGKGARNGQRQI